MIPEYVLVFPIVLPLLFGVLTQIFSRYRYLRNGISVVGSILVVGSTLAIAGRVSEHGRAVYYLGGELLSDGGLDKVHLASAGSHVSSSGGAGSIPLPYGILLEIDGLSAFMMAFSSFVLLMCLLYSLSSISQRSQRISYHTLWQFMTAGVMGAFSTGDLFNLFVWFEVLLMSSYVLVVLYGSPESTRSGFYYVGVNLVGSVLMLVSIGGIYAVVGTLNMAGIARRVSDMSGGEVLPIYVVSGLLFIAFLLKAGAFPFHFWVPEVYPAAPAPVTAALAGVVKKVGVYGLLRVFGTVLSPVGGLYSKILLVVAAASVVYGGWAAVSRDDVLEVLSYSSIGQVGFILLGVSVGLAPELPADVRAVGVAAAMVYSFNHSIIKSSLFLFGGILSDAAATTKMKLLGGVADRSPLLASVFLFGGLGLIGIPPFNGFFGKLLVFDSGVEAESVAVLAFALAGAVLTLLYVSRLWMEVFWGETGEATETLGSPDKFTLAPVLVLAGLVLLTGVFFEPILDFAIDAGGSAVDTSGYVDAVFGPGNWGGRG
ncbi:MAG: complex I subunit 5 family protein [Halobacteria archaeon]